MGQLIRTQTTVDFLETEENMYLEKELGRAVENITIERVSGLGVIDLEDNKKAINIIYSVKMDDGSDELNILKRVVLEKENKEWKISIIDDGEGIEKGFEDIKNIEIFEEEHNSEEPKLKKIGIIDKSSQIDKIINVFNEKVESTGYTSISFNNEVTINKKDGTKETYGYSISETRIYISKDHMSWYIDNPELVIEITKIFNEAIYNGGENMIVPYEVFRGYVEEKGYKVIPNKSIAFPIELPYSFEATIDLPKEDLYNIKVGKILEKSNEQSKKEGLDFYPYLEKNLMLYGSSLDTEGKYNQDVIVLMDGENIVGIWVSSEYGDEMQSDIGILSYLRSEF